MTASCMRSCASVPNAHCVFTISSMPAKRLMTVSCWCWEMESEEELNRLYDALKEDGGIRFELKKTEWGALHAVVEDKHSVVWSLNYMVG